MTDAKLNRNVPSNLPTPSTRPFHFDPKSRSEKTNMRRSIYWNQILRLAVYVCVCACFGIPLQFDRLSMLQFVDHNNRTKHHGLHLCAQNGFLAVQTWFTGSSNCDDMKIQKYKMLETIEMRQKNFLVSTQLIFAWHLCHHHQHHHLSNSARDFLMPHSQFQLLITIWIPRFFSQRRNSFCGDESRDPNI